MTINDIENFKDEVVEVLKEWFKGAGFKERKLTDTPTDDLQIVNKKYVDSITFANPGWDFVSYNTKTDSSISITGLNLQTDLQYQFIIQCRNVTNSGLLISQLNGTSSGTDHEWAVQAWRQGGAGRTDIGSTGDSNWTLGHNSGNRSFYGTMTLAYNSGSEMATWAIGGIGDAGDNNNTPSIANGMGYYTGNTNITSIVLSHNSGTNCEWKIWVFKATTS